MLHLGIQSNKKQNEEKKTLRRPFSFKLKANFIKLGVPSDVACDLCGVEPLPWHSHPPNPPQLLPPVAGGGPHAADLLSSIFIDWLSARDSNLVSALLLGFVPLHTGIRVAALRAACASKPG